MKNKEYVNIAGFIHSAEIAEKTLTTTEDEKINMYYIKNIYLKIDRKSTIGRWVGYAYTEDGKLLSSCLNGRKSLVKEIPSSNWKLTPDIVLEDDICALTRLWSDNYFHFLHEIIDKMIIAEELGFTGKYLVFHESWAEELIGLTGVSADRIIWIETGRGGSNTVYKINKYFDIDGFTQGTEKSIPRMSKFADRIISEFQRNDNLISEKQYPKRCYIKRKGVRKLLNCEDILKQYEFFTMIPEEYSVYEQFKYFYYADIVVCPHGAALANSCFMRNGTTFIELLSSSWINETAFRMLHYRGIHYRMLVESNLDRTEWSIDSHRDFSIDEKLLKYTLEDCISIYK